MNLQIGDRVEHLTHNTTFGQGTVTRIGMTKIEVFTSPTCPHCPAAVKVVEEAKKQIEGIEIEEEVEIDHIHSRCIKDMLLI